MFNIEQLFKYTIAGNINLIDVENWVESEKINYQKPDIKNNLAKFSENDLDNLIDKYSDWEICMNEFARTVSHYAESANELIDSDPDRAILIAKVRKIVSRLVPNPINLANADFQLGYLLWQTKHYHDAIQPLREAASLYSEKRFRGQSISILESSVLRATQILIACLFERGELPRSPSGITDNEIPHFISIFSPVASDAAAIAVLLDNLYRKLSHASLRDGVLYCQKTYLHTQLKEWELNRNIYSRQSASQLADEEVVSAASIEAQSIYLGFSPYTVATQLFDNKHLKLDQLAIYKEASVYCIPANVCSDEIRNFFSWLTLKPERIANFKSPFYLDLGEEDKEPSELHDFPLKLAQKNWMNYYPIVSAIDNAGETMFLLSAEALTYTCANLETFKNRLLQRVYDATKERSLVDEHAMKRLGNLRNEANRTFENFATEIARASGWYAETSLQRIGNEILPGGEIDVLMANYVNDELKIVLAEVKDFDITLHRIYSESSLGKKIRKAEKQLDKKSEAIRLLLPRLLTEVSKGEIDIAQINRISLIKIIITSDYLPPYLFTHYPGVALGELRKFLEGLHKGSEDFPSRFISHAWEYLTKS